MTQKKRLFKYFILPTMIQFSVLFLIIMMFVFFIGRGNGAPMLMPSFIVDGEDTDPNLARFLYMIVAVIAASVLFLISSGLPKSHGAGTVTRKFWFSTAGGILLWQSIGECSWHFGIPYVEAEKGFILLPHLESAAGLPMFILFLLLYFALNRSDSSDFSVRILLLSFICNWYGHISMIGTYPFVCTFMEIDAWYKLSGILIGSLTSLLVLLKLRKKDISTENLYTLSLVFYAGLGIIAMGLRGG